ncbi:4953_t:CDS:2, partial [Rhizophagus irregularis]
FKKRNGLQRVKFSGEANSAPIETLPEERVRLRALLAKYDKEDIYNADETGLFFRMEPNQTLSTGAVAGRKMDKSRVSVLFCANATGSHKIRPLVIGKSLNPRCFKNLNKSTLPVIYRANSKAWMRSDIFIEWLKHLDYYFRTMDRRLVYLPPNTTAHLQPMDAGIIHSFKAKYKQEFCRHLIRQFDSGVDHVKNKLNIKEAIDYIAESWNNVTPTTIQNCWIKTETADVLEYFQLLDREIPTEEHLTEEQIIDM